MASNTYHLYNNNYQANSKQKQLSTKSFQGHATSLHKYTLQPQQIIKPTGTKNAAKTKKRKQSITIFSIHSNHFHITPYETSQVNL